MTLVAQGASIYATTSGLDARPGGKQEEAGHKLWLQYPAMSSDLTPHVIGRLVEGGQGPAPTQLRLSRADGLWQSPLVNLDGQGAFVLSVELLARKPNVFAVEARAADGSPAQVSPATLTIVQGLTISDPPLSRTIGVALASDRVQEYFRKGAPLPARRTYVHHTVESVGKGSAESVLKIPIIQGEFEQAHLCRLVGTLEIPGKEIKASLPAGSAVELTIELDRGGRMTAAAFVPALQQVFSQVAHLLVPDAAPEVLEASLAAMRERAQKLPVVSFHHGSVKLTGELGDVEGELDAIAHDVAAARGGDADAAQKAKRALLELDAKLERAEVEQRWPELEEKAREAFSWASRWVSDYGTPAEQKHLAESAEGIERARVNREPAELQRQLRVINNLGTAAYYRHPEVWEWAFEGAAGRANEATDLPRANLLVRDGRKAMETGDRAKLRGIVEQLWKLLPADVEKRRLGHESGVR
jgi:molecular chaperone DnaK